MCHDTALGDAHFALAGTQRNQTHQEELVKLRMTLAIVGTAAFALAGTSANAGSGDKATGGGQTLVASSGTGPGSTIAFTAQQGTGGETSAKGQVQWIKRTNAATTAKGKAEEKYHGVVDCLEVYGNFATIGGYKKGGAPTADRFVLRVVDNGEGATGTGDTIQFSRQNDEVACGDGGDAEPQPEWSLSRGNAQVRDGGTPETP